MSSCVTIQAFKECCDHIFDRNSDFPIDAVQYGETIFVSDGDIDMEEFFLRVHPFIPPHIIITALGDTPIPGRFRSHLECPKLLGWFTLNTDTIHPKLHPIPLGIYASSEEYGDKAVFERVISQRIEKDSLLYMNFSVHYHPDRKLVFNKFKNVDYCTSAYRSYWANFVEHKGLPLETYLHDLSRHKFVLSPPGNGLNCFRTWEGLLMKCYPIVKTSPLDPLYVDLPVVVVLDWNSITREFLEEKYREFSGKEFKLEKLFMPYWIEQMKLLKFQSSPLSMCHCGI